MQGVNNFKISKEFSSELLIVHLGGRNACDFLLLHFLCLSYFFINLFFSLLLNFISLYESVLESQSSNESV
jgi:hypothetical protein